MYYGAIVVLPFLVECIYDHDKGELGLLPRLFSFNMDDSCTHEERRKSLLHTATLLGKKG